MSGGTRGCPPGPADATAALTAPGSGNSGPSLDPLAAALERVVRCAVAAVRAGAASDELETAVRRALLIARKRQLPPKGVKADYVLAEPR